MFNFSETAHWFSKKVVPFYIASSSVWKFQLFYMGEFSLIREQCEDESMCHIRGTLKSPNCRSEWISWVTVATRQKFYLRLANGSLWHLECSRCRKLTDSSWEGDCVVCGLCLWMFRAVSHLYTILSLMLFPSSEYIIYCLGTSLVPSMERPRPNWNVTFFQVHPWPLSFYNHSFVVYPRPRVTLMLQVSPFFVSGLFDSRVELVHATSPTRPISFRRYFFRYLSFVLIFIQRPNWNNILNLVVHFAENKMRIDGSIRWRKKKLLCLSPTSVGLTILSPVICSFMLTRSPSLKCSKLCN